MSGLCGGDNGFFKDLFWLIIYLCRRDKTKCPRCGGNAFQHGVPPRDDWYCNHCHLWEPDWDVQRKLYGNINK